MILLYEKIKPFIKLILTVLIAVVMMFLVYAAIGVDFKFEITAWAQLIVCVLLQCVLIGLWLPEGKTNGKNNEVYIANSNAACKAVEGIVNAKLYKELDDFCDYATKENITARIVALCAKKHIDYNRYLTDEYYKNKLTKKQLKMVGFAEKTAPRLEKKINATAITSYSAEMVRKYDISNHEKGQGTVRVAVKFVVSLLTSIIGVVITFTLAKSFVDGLAEALYWLAVMGSTIYFSLQTGYELVAITRNDYLKRLIDFLKRFDAWRLDNKK